MAFRRDAKSLSDITQIASYPPHYPRNPAATPRDPLTLYISRVPGTRDIILNTFKPLLKNVTVEDITACLYYLHFNTDTDAQLLGEEQSEETSEPIRKSLSRKPVPQSSPRSLDLSDSSKSSLSLTSVPSKSHSIRRKPVGEPAFRKSCEYPRELAHVPRRRRSLDYRPPSCAPTNSRKVIAATLKKSVLQSSFNPKTRPQISPEPDRIAEKNIHEPAPPPEDVFSITVVRRDPSSGAQWNVGTISGHPVIEETRSGRSSTQRGKKPYYDISIGLNTPGYLHFRDQNYDTGNTQPIDPEPKHQKSPKSHYFFERKVSMEGTGLWGRASAQRKRALSELSDKYNATLGSRRSEVLHDTHQVKEPQSKGYVFTSPWGGRCKFFTGGAGRSLLCQHTLPSPIGTGDSSLHQQTVTISELRFSIPGVSLFTSSKTQPEANGSYFELHSNHTSTHSQNKSNGQKASSLGHTAQSLSDLSSAIISKFEKQVSLRLYKDTRKRRDKESHDSNKILPAESQSNSYQDVDETRLDLSLGREKAGGGSCGTQVKMGKFIIHAEGLKMLDLVVCANMGIWWSVWDSGSKST